MKGIKRIGRWLKGLSLPFICLVIPLCGALYWLQQATPVYRSSTTFVIRSAEQGASALVSPLLRGFLGQSGSDIPATVRDFLVSPSFLMQIDDAFGLRGHYGQGDFLSRFPRPWDGASRESFRKYFQGRFSVSLDGQSQSITVSIDTFSPALSYRILLHTLDVVQRRVDSFNEQIRRDGLGLAEAELMRARQRLERAGAALVAYRRQHGILDPERQAAADLQQRQELESRLGMLQMRLEHALRVAPLASTTQALQMEVSGLRAALDALQARALGPQDGARIAHADRMAALALEMEIAAKVVMAAEEALARARIDVERRHVYVEVLSAPFVPDDSHAPRPVRVLGAVVFFGLLTMGLAWLLGVGVREHAVDHRKVAR